MNRKTLPPLFRRPAYLASPKSREALEILIKELLDLGLIRKVGHNEEVELTTPVIVAWRNGDFRGPKSREALEILIKELLDLGAIRKVEHNEEVEITTPVIGAWCNGKSLMVGDFRALNTYTIPAMYPIPKIQISLT
ncbi:hypothetical protein O181_035091 [Austropuccinia psidii MF-1]|uniref:Uncharacterized protein n=1 Tax=Austropuccinia psidii MF-1 TaxID=1389203 RepID=A0A9Q3D202_9BASI|nr:hypothetical protein [Austropuccinia psidii MF-1]